MLKANGYLLISVHPSVFRSAVSVFFVSFVVLPCLRASVVGFVFPVPAPNWPIIISLLTPPPPPDTPANYVPSTQSCRSLSGSFHASGNYGSRFQTQSVSVCNRFGATSTNASQSGNSVCTSVTIKPSRAACVPNRKTTPISLIGSCTKARAPWPAHTLAGLSLCPLAQRPVLTTCHQWPTVPSLP